jgi:hypothetical protein
MNVNNNTHILTYLRNIDRNTLIYYFFIFMIIFFILKNGFEISNHVFFALIISCAGIYIYFQKNKQSLTLDLNKIESTKNILNLKYYTSLSKDLNLVQLYYEALEYGKYDIYNFNDSLFYSNKLIGLYHTVEKKGELNYSHTIDLAKDYRDNAVNSFATIVKSLRATMGIIDGTHFIQQISVKRLHKFVIDLKNILDKYVFDIMQIGRTIYETDVVNINSQPIIYDATEPSPYKPGNTHDIYYGFILP